LKLWPIKKDDNDYYVPSPNPEPLITVRNTKLAIFICYDLVEVCRFGKLGPMGKYIKKEGAEVIMFPANWYFKHHIPEYNLYTALKKIPTLKAGLFSCSNKVAIAADKTRSRKISDWGWVDINV